MDTVNMSFPKDVKYVQAARALGAEMCALFDQERLPSNFVFNVKLAISEACTNSIIYAPAHKQIEKPEISFQIGENALVVIVKDNNDPFEFNGKSLPEEDEEGGRGIYIIKKVSDESYYTRKGDWNELTMVFNLLPGNKK